MIGIPSKIAIFAPEYKKEGKCSFTEASTMRCGNPDGVHSHITSDFMEKEPFNSIDHLRFVLIVLVILIHIVNFGTLYPHVKDTINFFFMPVFFMITGYLTNIRKTANEFALYLIRLALPYAIMVLGYSFLSIHLPVRDGITEFTLPAITRVLFVTSIGPYWFLHTMFVCGAIYYLCFKLFGRYGEVACFCILGAMLTVAVQYIPILTAKNAIFYLAGVGIRLFHGDFSRLFRPTMWAILPFIAAALYWNNGELGDWAVVILAISFTLFIPKCFQPIHGKPLAVMGFIGRNTFPIYIFHPIFTMAAKYMLPFFSFDATGILHAVTTILLSLSGSLAVAALLDESRLSYCFGRKKIMR